jgi:2-oxoglutarate ferredoxin oxidoreductase subunit beta
MINNFIYGMTGGQLAPTAPLGSIATTAPYGNIEPPFDICNLAKALGANYVARWTVSHPYQPIKSVKDALQKKGFSLVEIMSPCPTAYGRRNKLGDIKKLWKWYDDNTILIEDYERIITYGSEKEKEEIKNMFPIGVFQDIDKPGFFEAYENLVNRVISKDNKPPNKIKPKAVVRK